MTTPLLIRDQHDGEVDPHAFAPATAAVTEQVTATDAQEQRTDTPPYEPLTTDELAAPEARDSIQLIAQSPEQLFLHWNHAGDPSASLREAFADAATHYRLAVRLTDLGAASAQLFDASPARAQWLAAQPDRDYRADIGFHADGLPFVRLLSSTIVHTPRAAVSSDADAAPEFHITPADFSRLLEHTGYAPDTIGHSTTHDARDTTASSYCHFSSGQWSPSSGR